MSEDELIGKTKELENTIGCLYNSVTSSLRGNPRLQEKCLSLLLNAESNLEPPVNRQKFVYAKLDVVRVQMELRRVRGTSISSAVVLMIIYMLIAAIWAAYYFKWFAIGATAEELNRTFILGIPVPILLWSVIGSFTSMLLRAGQFPFDNLNEAARWLMFRPIVGVVMGVMTYLMVTAGLIVFATNNEVKTPQLIWVIAFIGSFSDTFSINILQKIIGDVRTFKESHPTGVDKEKKKAEDQTSERNDVKN